MNLLNTVFYAVKYEKLFNIYLIVGMMVRHKPGTRKLERPSDY